MNKKIRSSIVLFFAVALIFSLVSCSMGRDKNFQSDADILAFVKSFEDAHSETVVVSFKNEVSEAVTELISYPGKTADEMKVIKDSLELGDDENASISGDFMSVERNENGKYKKTAFNKTKTEISEYFLSQGYTATEIKVDSSGLNK